MAKYGHTAPFANNEAYTGGQRRLHRLGKGAGIREPLLNELQTK